MEQPLKPRRFCPELVETTKNSSRNIRDALYNTHSAREHEMKEYSLRKSGIVDNVENRRFEIKPVETSTRTTREPPQGADNYKTNEDGVRSHASRPKAHDSEKYSPQPFECSIRSNYGDLECQEEVHGAQNVPSVQPQVGTEAPDQNTTKKPARRKFSPMLIETAKRSRKSGDSAPALLPQDKTNHSPGDVVKEPRPPETPDLSASTSLHSGLCVPHLLQPIPNRQGSMYPHYTTRVSSRQHSFKVPDLEAIASSESSEADQPDRSQAGKAASSGHADSYQDATRRRESVDDRVSGYLLALAARSAEKQLRDQEAAVFPNTDFHEPVAHYMDRDDSQEGSSSSDPRGLKHPTRQESGDEKATIRAMQRHGEQFYARKQGQATNRIRNPAFNLEFDSDAHQDAWVEPAAPQNIIGGHQVDPDLKQMRKAASPPMLGGDIYFPRCPSPEHARFDVTQGSEFLRNSMCYLTNDANVGHNGLWGASADRRAHPPEETPSILTDPPNKQCGSVGGLWGGCCTGADPRPSPTPTGLVTPRRTPTPTGEKDNPFNGLSMTSSLSIAGMASRHQLPPSPPMSNRSLPTSPTKTKQTRGEAGALDAEFPDSFVTQVYNYVSLGFPAIARSFDPELSKISGIAVAELRLDDKLTRARGYIRLGDDEPSCLAEGVDASECRRWCALRVYCKEWGRQMGIMDEGNWRNKRMEDPHRAWGLPGRKGSWAN